MSSTQIAKDTARAHEGEILDGRYRVTRKLQETRRWTSYAANELRLRHDVAIVILAATAEPGLAERFLMLAQTFATFEHPNCDHVKDVGRTADGSPYVVMPLLEGCSLDALIAAGPMEPSNAARVAVAILRGLAHAHRHQIVHRGLRPACIVVPLDGLESARVTDFWSASVRDPGHEQVGVTMADLAVGLAEYNSPEQALGLETDERTDLYSAGIILFEMLAGHPPFFGADPVGVLQMHIDDPLPLLSPAVAPALVLIVERLAAKSADHRYASASDAIIDLESFLAESTVQARISTDPNGFAQRWVSPSSQDLPTRPANTGAGLATAPGVEDIAPPDRRGASVLPWVAAVMIAIAGVSVALLWPNAPSNEVVTAASVEPDPRAPTAAADQGGLSRSLRSLAMVNEPDLAKAPGFEERHALIDELTAAGHADKIDARLQTALDLLQAADSPTPCKTFDAALAEVEKSKDGYFDPTLADAVVPSAAAGRPDESCTTLPERLSTLRGEGTIVAAAPERDRPHAAGSSSSSKGRAQKKRSTSPARTPRVDADELKPPAAAAAPVEKVKPVAKAKPASVIRKIDDGLHRL